MSGGQSGSMVSILSTQIQAMQYPPAAAYAMVLVTVVAIFVAGTMRVVDVRKELVKLTGADACRTRPDVGPSATRPWTFYVLGGLFCLYLLFLYGPMIVIYILSFQGPNGGVTFPMNGVSLVWFRDISRSGRWGTFQRPSNARSRWRCWCPP